MILFSKQVLASAFQTEGQLVSLDVLVVSLYVLGNRERRRATKQIRDSARHRCGSRLSAAVVVGSKFVSPPFDSPLCELACRSPYSA